MLEVFLKTWPIDMIQLIVDESFLKELIVSTSTIAASIAVVLAVGLVVTVGMASLLSGAFHFLFARPSLVFLLPKNRETGFAFGLKWNSAREPARFDKVKVRLFNPFGSPTQVEVSREFKGQGSSFGMEVDMGEAMTKFWQASNFDRALVQVEISSNRDGLTQQFEMRGAKFKEKFHAASITVDQFQEKHKIEKTKPLFHTVERSFIAEAMPSTNKVLKLATNPVFADSFAAAPAAGGKEEGGADNNFAVSKVWIEPGCIVCDACEGIYPAVFEVTSDTCIIRPDAPLNNGLLIQDAAEACPVEVIKFTKAS
jgi:ferredoxin